MKRIQFQELIVSLMADQIRNLIVSLIADQVQELIVSLGKMLNVLLIVGILDYCTCAGILR